MDVDGCDLLPPVLPSRGCPWGAPPRFGTVFPSPGATRQLAGSPPQGARSQEASMEVNCRGAPAAEQISRSAIERPARGALPGLGRVSELFVLARALHLCSSFDVLRNQLQWRTRQRFRSCGKLLVILAMICNQNRLRDRFSLCRLHRHWPRKIAAVC